MAARVATEATAETKSVDAFGDQPRWGRPFEDARRELVRRLAEHTGAAEIEACHLLGQAVLLRRGNLVNPNHPVAAAIDRRLVENPSRSR